MKTKVCVCQPLHKPQAKWSCCSQGNAAAMKTSVNSQWFSVPGVCWNLPEASRGSWDWSGKEEVFEGGLMGQAWKSLALLPSHPIPSARLQQTPPLGMRGTEKRVKPVTKRKTNQLLPPWIILMQQLSSKSALLEQKAKRVLKFQELQKEKEAHETISDGGRRAGGL